MVDHWNGSQGPPWYRHGVPQAIIIQSRNPLAHISNSCNMALRNYAEVPSSGEGRKGQRAWKEQRTTFSHMALWQYIHLSSPCHIADIQDVVALFSLHGVR